MNINFESKKWLVFVRVIMVLLGVIQIGLLGWAKFITAEVLGAKTEMAAQKSDMTHVKEDVQYIRARIDSVFELRRR